MRFRYFIRVGLVLLGLWQPCLAVAQDEGQVSLGDLARSLRKSKPAPSETVIDNDNLSKVMQDAEAQRLNGRPVFLVDETGKQFQVKSPDGTCSLSFSANATALLSSPYVPQDLPESELAKLDGPATIDNGTLQVSVYNGTGWNLKEITVGLTIVRRATESAAYYGSAKLVPASDINAVQTEKRSDLTVLYHLKGTAAPFATAVFQQNLGAKPASDQEWHWAIIQAQGIPPQPSAAAQK